MLTLSYGLWRVWVPLANTPLPSLIVPFCSRIYGGPQLSRQKQNTSRQNRKPNGKNKNLTAKPKTSRQKQKPHGKTENFVYFVFAVKFLVLPWRILLLPWGFWFCCDSCGSPYESDSNSEIWLLRWYQTYCLKLCSLSVDVTGVRTTGKFLAVS